LLNQDWQWFSRSGSLIVILGIYLTSSQIIENSHRLGQRRSAHKDGNFQRDWARDKQEKILHHARNHEEETWVMGKCGFNLLIIGTLIWGFGDLLSYFL
jgi:flagellar biogenesis protein FliO